MSNQTNSQVEERIVSMRFDNKQFEQGVKTTMNSLKNLETATKFKNSASSIDNLQKSLDSINLNGATVQINNFETRLTALQVFAKRTIEKFTDAFWKKVGEIKHGIDGVFRQIEEGGERRAQNIAQAKFQLEGLGVAWNDIEKDISFAVNNTAYGLDSAARIGAQLSASGIQIGDDMAHALRAVSGLAAMTNSSYDDIGRIFTQIAGAGRLYTQDMLQISSRGLNLAAALGDQLGKTESEIREMVTKGQIDFKMFAEAMYTAFGEQAVKANETYNGALSNTKAALSRLGADIATAKFEALRLVFVAIIPKLNDLKKALTPAIEEISKLIAVVGEFAQKVINRINVTTLGSNISKVVEFVGGKLEWFIGQMSKMIDKIDAIENMTKAVSKGSEMLSAREAHIKKIKEATDELTDSTEDSAEAAKEMDENTQKALKAAQDIWSKGTYGNGQARIDALTAAGIDPKLTQKIIDEFVANGGDWEKAVQKIVEETKKADDATNGTADKLSKKFENLARTITNLKRIFKATFTSIKNVVGSVFDSIREAFGGKKGKESTDESLIVSFTGKVADLAEQFKITEEKAAKLKRPLKTVVSALKTVGKAVMYVGGLIATVIAAVVKFIFETGRKIARTLRQSDIVGTIKKALTTIWDSLKSIFNSIAESDFLKTIGENVLKVVMTIINAIAIAFSAVAKFISGGINVIKTVATAIYGFFAGVGTKVKDGITNIGDFIKALYTDIKDGTIFDKIKEKIDKLTHPTDGYLAGNTLLSGVLDWIRDFTKGLVDKIKSLKFADVFNALKDALYLGSLVAVHNILKSFGEMFESIPDLIEEITDAASAFKRAQNMAALLAVSGVIWNFAKAIALIVGSVVAATMLLGQDQKYMDAFSVIMGEVLKLILYVGGVILVIEAAKVAISMFKTKMPALPKQPFKIPFFVSLASLISAVALLGRILERLSKLSTEDFKTGAIRLAEISAGVLVFLTVSAAAVGLVNRFLSATAGGDTGDAFSKLAILMLSMAVSIDLLMIAMATITGLVNATDAGKVWTAFGVLALTIGVIAVAIGGVMAAVNLTDKHGKAAETLKSMAWVFGSIAISMMFIVNSIINMMVTITAINKFGGSGFAAFWSVTAGMILIIGAIAAVAFALSKSNKHTADSLKGMIWVIAAIGLLGAAIGNIASKVDDENDVFAVCGAALAMMGMVGLMIGVIKSLSDKNIKYKKILALSTVFVAVGAMLVPLIWFKNENWKAIGMGAVLVAGVLLTIGGVISSLEKIDASKILSLAVVFASLGVMMTPLIFMAGQDWGAILAAGAALGIILGVLTGMFAVVKNSSMNFMEFGFGMVMLSAGIGGLGSALAYFSSKVDVNGLKMITVTLSILIVLFGALMIVCSKAPHAVLGMMGLAVGILAISGAIGLAIYALDYLLKDVLPRFLQGVLDVAYTLGAVIPTIIQGFVDKIRELLGINSPSKVFEEIGMYCVEGLVNGLKTIAKLPGKIVTWAKEGILDPFCDFFGIHSPSWLMEMLGKYMGEGLENGIRDKFENFDTSMFTDLGDTLQNGVDGIGSLDFSNLTGGFNTDDLFSGTDTDIFGSLGTDITAGVNKSIADAGGVDWTKIYNLNDLIANENIYNLLKSANETVLTKAYETWQEQQEFLSKNMTFDDYISNIAENYDQATASLYDDIMRNGDKDTKDSLMGMFMKDWIDSRRLPEEVSQYMVKAKEEFYKAYNGTTLNREEGGISIPIRTHLVKSNGEELLRAFDNPKGLTMTYEDSEVNKNMKAISEADNRSADVRASDMTSNIVRELQNQKNVAELTNKGLDNVVREVANLGADMTRMRIQLDTGVLVGELVGPIDTRLGARAERASRR